MQRPERVKPVEMMHPFGMHKRRRVRRVLTSNPSGMLEIVDVNRVLTRAPSGMVPRAKHALKTRAQLERRCIKL